ncbi:probable aspartyl aminopeptidase isoform X2 [Juglans microcarpa x Juglans regia]|uniref:probable aspartyl aminopeptidase isoform X2 n=1 Tax=Juglans microcarpa x Juglans regia TaxID=2249226 RepID=UPI001B7E6891|nr:probable aspartyl aminopeptidase isoform X2 [Juglans microcarpa x Juglans regia]
MGQVLKGIAEAIGQGLAHGVVLPGLIEFLNASPTAFHAIDEAKKRLVAAGYEQVLEREDWKLEVGKKYFFTRNYSSIIAFAIGKKYVAGNGFHIIGAHTDSPCLKLKPVSKVTKGGYLEVGVQTYGGGLWHTWFDRDLTVAGRVIIREAKNGSGSVSYSHRLVRIEEPIMRIPTLAIHLDRDVNDGFMVNTQNHLLPVLATSIEAELNKNGATDGSGNSGGQTNGKNGNGRTTTNSSKHHSLLLQLLATRIGCEPDDICDFELQACDTQPSIIAGATKEFIFSGRLDNLCMSFCSLMLLEKAIQRSFLVSADMSHALHPNYMDKHEDNHQPKLRGGLVINHNANQSFATNAVTSFIFGEIARKNMLPIQEFVVRNDMACGSTIGPILASGVGIRTVDVGAPQLSMHSIREMCAADDVVYSYRHFIAYFQEFSRLDANLTVDGGKSRRRPRRGKSL